MTDALRPDGASDDARRTYDAPSLQPLGSIDAVTAGPNEGGGNIDQLFGGTGGFNAVPDGTS